MFPNPQAFRRRAPAVRSSYGVAAVSVTAALGIARLLEIYLVTAPVSLFLCAIMFSAWFGGARPGLFAAALANLAFVYYFVAPGPSLAVSAHEIPRTVMFALAGLFVVSLSAAQQRITEALREENVERTRGEVELRRSERLLRLVLDALPVGVAVTDASGNIVLTNPASQRIWAGTAPSSAQRYAESKGWWHATGQQLAREEWASVRALTLGESSVNDVVDIEAFDGVRKVIQNSAVPIRDLNGRITGAVVVNEDISGRMLAERELYDSWRQMRTLTGRVMRAQDVERRRIARMLHETTAQNLAALKMLLARLNRTADGLGESDRHAVTESIALAEQSMTEIRTLSYLLHPPFLDEAGLISALRWYAAGFAGRSGVAVDLDLPETFGRLPLDTETALFRIVQEALINIHRHSGSETARIRLRREAESLMLEIEDQGQGIPAASLKHILQGGGDVGVGIAGMSERLEQLGGRLEITSAGHGTSVRARLPITQDGA
jgi:two-component system NarL family sensor kinase